MQMQLLDRRRKLTDAARLLSAVLVSSTLVLAAQTAMAELSKGHRNLIDRGLQIQGMVRKDDVFHLET